MVQAEPFRNTLQSLKCDDVTCCEYSRLLVFRTNISKASSNQLQQSTLPWEYCLTTVRKPSVTPRCVSAAWLLLLLWQWRQLENLLDGLMI